MVRNGNSLQRHASLINVSSEANPNAERIRFTGSSTIAIVYVRSVGVSFPLLLMHVGFSKCSRYNGHICHTMSLFRANFARYLF
jgi:hypothetical protein